MHWNLLIYFFISFYFSVLVAYKMLSDQLVPQRMYLKRWFVSIYSYLNRLQASPALTHTATTPQQTFTRQFWSSWYQRARTITLWEINTIIIKLNRENTSIFRYQSLCFKLICRITRTIVQDITTCYQQRTTSSSNILSRPNAFVKRPIASRKCRATGEIGFWGLCKVKYSIWY